MSVQEVSGLITSVGFPIVCCIAMMWYVKYMSDKNQEQVNDMRTQHMLEIKQITDALNNNTIALTTLCERLTFESR